MQNGSREPCREALEERSAIIQYDGQGCYTRAEADQLARRQAVEAMHRAGAQRELFETGET
jgi:hypothetical protein